MIPNQQDRIAVSSKRKYISQRTCNPFYVITDLVLRVEVDVSPNQIETYGSIKYILIGDVGQTKEDELYKYNFRLSNYVTFIIIL